jgi:hypothetical protein
MTEKKRPSNSKPATDVDVEPSADENDTQGHSLLSAQLGGVMANERNLEAARWAREQQARKQQNQRKDGHR